MSERTTNVILDAGPGGIPQVYVVTNNSGQFEGVHFVHANAQAQKQRLDAERHERGCTGVWSVIRCSVT